MRWMALAALALLSLGACAGDDEATSALDVRVLYAGDADAPRTEDWRQFLTPYVTAFDAIDRASLSMETAAGFDVVIVDSPSPYKESGVEIPAGAPVDLEFTKPVILMGAAGGSTLGPLNIKLDWL